MSTTSIPSNIIKINKASHTLETPIIILKNRNFNVIGEIKHFTNWNISFQAVGIDEISFDVYRELNDEECDVWDKLIDLAIIEVKGYGHFEISVTINEENEIIKSVVGQSLEVELGQITLEEFHVNDDDATTMEETEYNEDDFDDEGNFIPTVFCNFDDEQHSLLHRVLADKAPHWSIGHVPTYISINKTDKPELASTFQRTYTVDGTSIYDFLMNDVAEESNVFFIFDTYNRKINCYNAEDFVWTDGTEVISINAYGEDTTIFVDMDNLANQITLSGDKDSVKNCFRVSGGDDVITDFVRVANITGDNYIWLFSQTQLDDMPTDLSESILDYQEFINSDETQDTYYGENGIFTRLCAAYDKYYLLESELMPQVGLEETTAYEQYNNVVNGFNNMDIGVYSYDNYNDDLFIGVTNNVIAMAQIFVDSRYTVDVIDVSTSYNSNSHIWKGRIKVYRNTDEIDSYGSPDNEYLNVQITVDTDDELPYTKQKIMKALASGDIEEIDFNITTTSTNAEKEAEKNRIYNYLDENYCRVRLQSFDDAYETCISILSDLMSKNDSIVAENLYYKYSTISSIVKSVLDKRTKEVEDQESLIFDIELEQEEFQETVNFENYLINRFYDRFKEEIGDEIDEETGEEKALIATKEYVQELYKVFCMYRREDEYQNDNYISDGKTDSEIIEIAKELLTVAKEEVKKACLLQRTISTDLNNLLVMEEFEPFYDKFALFNYIRVETNNELFKLRLMGIDYDSNSPEKINVTFSENIESINGTVSDLQSMYDTVATISSSYSSTMLQAKSGKIASNEVANLYSNGLNAALMKVTSSNNNEVTLGAYGLLCKEMTDEGVYSLNQVRLIGKGLYMTTDGWQTVRACLGETEDGVYGLIADQVVGKLFAGEKLLITNESDSVTIDGSGIIIKSGNISSDVTISELTSFKKDVASSLGVTTITSNSIISPKIGGGYLYIANDDYSVEIDPNHTSSNTHVDYVFCIKDKNKITDDIIMGVTNNGEGYFKGSIYADAGEFNGNIIGGTIKIGDNFNVTNNGLTTTKNLTVTDAIYGQYTKNGIVGYNEVISFTECSTQSFGRLCEYDNTTNMWVYSGQSYGVSSTELSTIKIKGSVSEFDSSAVFNSVTLFNKNAFFNKPAIFNNAIAVEGAIDASDAYVSTNILYTNTLTTNGDCKASGFYDLETGCEVSYWKLTNVDGAYCVGLASDTESFRPYYSDNTKAECNGLVILGHKNHKWGDIYSTNSTIQTSDRNLKEHIESLTDKHLQFLLLLQPASFLLKDGTSGRTHIGFIAQDVEEAMNNVGISDLDFAGFIKYKKTKTVIKEDGTEIEEEILDEDGNFIYEYALRYGEFISLITYGVQNLYKEVDTLKNEIKEIKEAITN